MVGHDGLHPAPNVRVVYPGVPPFHQFLIAKSGNPNDPVLLLDPYKDEIKIMKPGDRYMGILIDSITFIKPPGKGGEIIQIESRGY